MIVFPNCKVNLGLNILKKREDGYHNIETVFYPIPLHDIFEVVLYNSKNRTSSLPFSFSGIPVKGSVRSNLCHKAFWLLKKDFPNLPHIAMHLHKVIPSGAGLGGGSANAAFALTTFNKLFALHLTEQQLISYAAELGSDCPFFIINKPCSGSGRGEILQPVQLDLSGYKMVLVNPGIHINTGDAFRQLAPSAPALPVKEAVLLPVQEWKNALVNDFEKVIFSLHPAIAGIKEQLYNAGAMYASMSGSGSTVFGLFNKADTVALPFPSSWFVKKITGL